MPEPPCPPKDQLQAFLLGQLKDEAIGEISAHIDHCPPCEDTVASMEQHCDTVLRHLGRKQQSQFAGDEHYQNALALVREFGGDASLPAGAAEDRSDDVPLGNLREYELLEKLGEGGMGAVYKARHSKLDKIVAIKVLPKDKLSDEQAVARFEREMRAVGKLEHPNIVRAMDAGQVEGTHFLVMEYVRGVDLSQLVRQHGPLPINAACELIRQAAIGLDEADEHGMVHRDIKPSNLMLARGSGLGAGGLRKSRSKSSPKSRTPSPIVKILDLGLALMSETHAVNQRELTHSGQMMGTLDYMAPEQGGDTHNVDIRADIYSLGATLYKLLTGEAIYHGEKYATPVQKMMALAVTPAPPIQDRRADIPDELAAIVHRMLQKNPDDRYADPQAVAEALAPFCAGADLNRLLTDERPEQVSTDASLSATDLHASSSELDTDPVGTGCQPVHESGTASASHKFGAGLPTPPQPATAGLPAADPSALTIAPQIDVKPTPKSKSASGTGKLSVPTMIAGGAGLLGIVGLLAAMVFYFQTPHGTLRVEVTDPDIAVTVKGEDIVLTNADKEPIKLKAGQHTLIVTRDDFTFETKQLTLKKGETTTVKVELLPGKVQVVSAGKLIGQRPVQSIAGARHRAENWSLRFDGKTTYVFVEGFDIDWSRPFTIEARVVRDLQGIRDNGFGQGSIAFSGGENGFVLGSSSVAAFKVRTRHGEDRYEAIGAMPDNSHIACVWTGNKSILFIDGKLVASSPEPSSEARSRLQEPDLYLGAGVNESKEIQRHFAGILDEVRISNIARYDENFTPASRYEPDEHTLALYHFDEGAGDVLHDSSGNDHHGKIVGAKWVPVDRPIINAQDAEYFPPGRKVEILNFVTEKLRNAKGFARRNGAVHATGPGGVGQTVSYTDIGVQVAGSYKLGIDFEFHEASTSEIAISLPIGERFVTAIIKPFVCGLQKIDGLHVDGNSSGRTDGLQLAIEERHAASISVSVSGNDATIIISLDAKEVLRWSGAIHRLSATLPGLGPKTPVLAAYRDSVFTIHRLSLELVNGSAKLLRQEDAAEKPPSWDASSAPPAPLGNYALKFEGESSLAEFVKIPAPPVGREYTLEAYVTPLQLPREYSVIIDNQCESNRYLQVNHGFWSFVSVKDDIFNESRSENRVRAGERVHIAATVVDEKVTLFVDGVRQDGKSFTGPQRSTYRKPVTRITSNSGENSCPCIVDELRISNTVRYNENFAPAARHEPDEHTVALYHFDEGQGEVLYDHSDNQRHCKIVGAEWVRVELAGDRDVITPQDGRVDLLPLTDTQTDSVSASWERVDDGVRSDNPEIERQLLKLPVQVLGDYRLRVQFTKLAGRNFNLVLPIADRQVKLTIDGWQNDHISGLGNINGQPARANATKTTTFQAEIGTSYAVDVSVKRNGETAHFEVDIDQRPLLRWQGALTSLSDDGLLVLPHESVIGLSANYARIVIHSAELEMINGKARLLRPGDAAKFNRAADGSRDTPPTAVAPLDEAQAK